MRIRLLVVNGYDPDKQAFTSLVEGGIPVFIQEMS
jgi:hypothetical protein